LNGFLCGEVPKGDSKIIMQVLELFRNTPHVIRQVPAVYDLEPRRRVRDLQDWAGPIQLHMVPAINRRAVFSALDKADKRIREVLRGIEFSLFPEIAVGKVEELEVLPRKALLDGVYEGSANCVVVVQPRRDQVRETLGEFGSQYANHRKIKYTPEVDRLEDLPFRIRSNSLLVHRGHVGMEEDDPVEILVRLAAYGGQAKPLEEGEAMLQPIESLRVALLDPHIEPREDQMTELHTIGCF
jgi:hypothetical protein